MDITEGEEHCLQVYSSNLLKSKNSPVTAMINQDLDDFNKSKQIGVVLLSIISVDNDKSTGNIHEIFGNKSSKLCEPLVTARRSRTRK
jgi:hypothetical protein